MQAPSSTLYASLFPRRAWEGTTAIAVHWMIGEGNGVVKRQLARSSAMSLSDW